MRGRPSLDTAARAGYTRIGFPDSRRRFGQVGDDGGGFGVGDDVRRLLQQHLTEAEFQRLDELTAGFRPMPFVYDEELQAFHVRDEWLLDAFADPETIAEETVELLLKAADILSEHREQLDCRRLGEPPAEEEEAELAVAFAPAEMMAAAHLEELLDHTDYRYESRDTPAAYVITVRYRFRTEHEYNSRRGHIQWLIELARRLGGGRSFKGERLS